MLDEIPPPNVQQALVAIYLLQDWHRLKLEAGEGYGPSWFKTHGVVVGIVSVEARKSAMRLVRSGRCVGCGEDVPPDSSGDHLLLLAYARLHFRHHVRLGTTGRVAPEPLAAVVSELAAGLPTDEHRYMLRQRVSWVTGKRW